MGQQRRGALEVSNCVGVVAVPTNDSLRTRMTPGHFWGARHSRFQATYPAIPSSYAILSTRTVTACSRPPQLHGRFSRDDRFYERMVPQADDIYDQHVRELIEEEQRS